jgi:hypothetical protein
MLQSLNSSITCVSLPALLLSRHTAVNSESKSTSSAQGACTRHSVDSPSTLCMAMGSVQRQTSMLPSKQAPMTTHPFVRHALLTNVTTKCASNTVQPARLDACFLSKTCYPRKLVPSAGSCIDACQFSPYVATYASQTLPTAYGRRSFAETITATLPGSGWRRL